MFVLRVFARLGVARRERPALFLACVLAALILLPFYGSYMYWEGGYCFGPRHFVPLLPLLLLLLPQLQSLQNHFFLQYLQN